MAAKQGITAHLSQASEDAKRAVLQRTPLRSSWFSNLNTTMTIKSAPPRTPEVLSLLSTKSGFLLKRNEQHVWQSRWCCVVPHMFLYYFDADMSVEGESPPQQPSPQLQEELNDAVKKGGRKSTAPRSSLNIFSPGTGTAEEGGEKEKFSTLQPTGIIDLECYSSVHRSRDRPDVLELAGDDSVNPDLRAFYFCASSAENGDDWTQAMLSGRHSALLDERDAYKQVCDGFSLQLQHLHQKLDIVEKNKSDAEEECYRVRSQQEEVRRSCLKLIHETLERETANEQPFAHARRAYRTDLETIRHQDMGLAPAVQLVCDYTSVLEVACCDLRNNVERLEEQQRESQAGDTQKLRELEEVLKEKELNWCSEKERLEQQVETLQDRLKQSQKNLKDSQQDLATQKMEFAMYQSSSKNKVQELTSHRKILKKEVIDLRRKLDNAGSEVSLLKHHSKTSKLEVEQERKKTELLERYVEKMESQVKVQQNMMEMMSQGYDNASRASFSPSNGGFARQGGYGADNASRASFSPSNGGFARQGGYGGEEFSSPRHKDVVVVNTPSTMDEEDIAPRTDDHSQLLRKAMEDDKSHMSELTEDRTQRHFDAAAASAGLATEHESQSVKRYRRPPAYIGVTADASHPKLDTIDSSAASFRALRRLPDEPSVNSFGSSQKKLSVAQRSRLEAERSSGTPVRVRAPSAPPNPLTRPRSAASQNSFLTSMARSISDALDGSVLGVPDLPSSDDEDASRSGIGSSTTEGENERPVSEAGSSLSLQERQQMQKAKQIAFLRERGLLKSDDGLRGGAGGRSSSTSYVR